MTTARLGVCYYPEHWPESRWQADARHMQAMGIAVVRIAEFAWSRLEPAAGDYRADWLLRALDILHSEGLEVCLGTPTATPPKWLVDAYSDILARDAEGRPRGFGSRRHYSFSSPSYWREAERITDWMAKTFGSHPAVKSWQTDNEYGCHDTVRCYSAAARGAFQAWLAARYDTIEALNTAWGNVFWSMDYSDFDAVELPNLSVTEPNPSHVLDFYRFSSDQVIAFNRMQVDILRTHSPDRPVGHNLMGHFSDFDHFALGRDLDFVGWDSYPLGFLDQSRYRESVKARYRRQGHPDFAAFHHDLYRAAGGGRMWVMEQQPGPVNWAPHNPAPLEAMVRAWTLEAAAHGAEVISYFRWRQVPFAQEQMHAGLLLPDGREAPAAREVRESAASLASGSPCPAPAAADVALVFCYEAAWIFAVQPQGASWHYSDIVLEWYTALRRAGLNVDIVPPGSPLDAYKAVFVPSLPHISPAAMTAFERCGGELLFGPRSGSKTENLTIPDRLAPGPLQALLPLKVLRSESFPAAHIEPGIWGDRQVAGTRWLDHIDAPEMQAEAVADSGQGLLYRQGRAAYLATLPNGEFLAALVADMLARAGVAHMQLPADLRLQHTETGTFVVNYGPAPCPLPARLAQASGVDVLQPAGTILMPAADGKLNPPAK